MVLDRLASPLGPLLHAAATGSLAGAALPQWRPGTAVVVVIAAEGYPEAPVKGDTIHFTERSVAPAAGQGDECRGSPSSSQVNPGIHHAGTGAREAATGARDAAGATQAQAHAYLLHAGTARDATGELLSAGGRVLNVVGSGSDAGAARGAAYELAGTVEMRGGWYRRDIAAGQ